MSASENTVIVLAHEPEYGWLTYATVCSRDVERAETDALAEGFDLTEVRKSCTGCQEVKALSDFYPDPRRKSGRRARCRDCEKTSRVQNQDRRAAYAKGYQRTNREKIKAYQATWYRANRERIAARAKAYQKANRKKIRSYERTYEKENHERIKARKAAYQQANPGRIAYKKAWSKANPEKRAAYQKTWRKANREVLQVQQRRRRKRLVGKIAGEDWRRLVARHNGLCAYCQERPATEIDHVIPVSRGGRHTIGNVLPACRSCNLSKRARLLIEWNGRPRF
jgi:hypothetical protein